MNSRLAARTALLAALAAVWAVSAYLLWQSKVPSSLHLPHLDPHAYFSDAELRRAHSYARFSDFLFWVTTLVQLLALVVYARFGARYVRESAAGPIGTGMLLGMLGFALVWAVELPFGVLDLWWQRRHGISHVGYAAYLFGGWFELGGEFVFLTFALAVVMGLARKFRDHWWIAAAPVFVGLGLLFGFVGPYLTPTHRLDDPVLLAAATRLEAEEHVGHVPIDVEDVRDVTSLPNAEAMGIGPSRRVVVWDTLVDGRFTESELRVVIAHELGHLARNHLLKAIGWYALFAFPGAYLLARATRSRGGMGEPEAVPLSLLVLVGLSLLALPLENAISRHREAEADWIALQTTRDPAAATRLFRRFVPTTLDEPSPSTIDYLVLENHPTIMQRIAMAQAWRRAGTP
jgi:STE24 endopeptidase